MSSPPNRLSNFRSYTYYHVLVVCDSSATAEALTTATAIERWLHPADSKYGVSQIKTANAVGNYVVLINGSTDADFVIEKAKWATFTAASATQGDHNSSIAVEGEMTISEPRGVVFTDTVVQACISLGVDASMAVFALKTFFVGYSDNDMTITEYINDVEPIYFIVYDLQGTFTETGGMYELSFVALTDGAARLPQFSKSARGFSYNLAKPGSASKNSAVDLPTAMKELEIVVQENYDTYYNCAMATIKEYAKSVAPNDSALSDQMLSRYCRVSYTFNLDQGYEKPGEYLIDNNPEQFKTSSDCSASAPTIAPPGKSIEDVLRDVINRSSRIAKEAKRDENGVMYEPKIHSAVESILDGNTIKYIVRYTITRTPVPKSLAVDQMMNMTSSGDAELAQKVRENVIVFDYLYSGKNIDILEFDIKLNMGLAYMQMATVANSLKDNTEAAPAMYTCLADPAPGDRFGQMKIPIFFGSQLKTPYVNNSQYPADTAKYAYTLSKHSSIELAEAQVKITGNCNLLNSANKSTIPSASGSAPKVGSDTEFTHWSYIPAFAKINIFMPASNDDLGFFDKGQGAYTKPFWYQGYYYVYGMEHIFDHSEANGFVQRLMMIAMPDRSIADAAERSATADKTHLVADCFDGKSIKCSPETTKNATTATAKPPVTSTGTPKNTQTKADVDSASRKRELSSVKGWNNAKPEVKQAIIKAAANTGVDVVTLATICSVETGSKFNPNAKNPNSSATGLFQFIDSTWLGYCGWSATRGSFANYNKLAPAGVVTTSTTHALQQRTDAYASAYAGALMLKESGASNVSDAYMHHFLGAGDYQKVIAASNNGHGDEPLSFATRRSTPAASEAAAASIIAANGLPVGTTVDSLRQHFANVVSKKTGQVHVVEKTTDPDAVKTGSDMISTHLDCAPKTNAAGNPVPAANPCSEKTPTTKA